MALLAAALVAARSSFSAIPSIRSSHVRSIQSHHHCIQEETLDDVVRYYRNTWSMQPPDHDKLLLRSLMGTELLYPHEHYKPRGRDTPVFPQAHQLSWAWYFVILTSISSLTGAVLGYPHEHLKHHGRYTSVTPRAPQASCVWYFDTPMSTSSDAVLGIITSTSFDTHE
ncbi:hypothetical protein M0R45_016596 [Rubus argutus]|uniref:Uncharacterized protein n=1 Tax=Rubus argutus TaxID=59490 RepID=A0AAW1XSD9_RUBAR